MKKISKMFLVILLAAIAAFSVISFSGCASVSLSYNASSSATDSNKPPEVEHIFSTKTRCRAMSFIK